MSATPPSPGTNDLYPLLPAGSSRTPDDEGAVGNPHHIPIHAYDTKQGEEDPLYQDTYESKIELAQRRAAARENADIQIGYVEQTNEKELNLTLWDQSGWTAKVYAILEVGSFPSDIPQAVETASVIVGGLTIAIILLSCASILALSDPYYMTNSAGIWSNIEVFCVVLFTMDLIIRFVTCPSQLNFIKDLFNWIDLFSILPYYVGLFGWDALPWYMRIIRALRVARMLKMFRSYGVFGLRALLHSVQESLSGALLFVIVAGTGMLVFSTMSYFAERGEFDRSTGLWWRDCRRGRLCNYSSDVFLGTAYENKTNVEVSPYQSIAGSFWFVITTLTTTGSGEQESVSSLGRLITSVMCFVGIFLIGMPTMVLAGNHEASKRQGGEQVIRNTWEKLVEKQRRLLKNSNIGSLEILTHFFAFADPPSADALAKSQSMRQNPMIPPSAKKRGEDDDDGDSSEFSKQHSKSFFASSVAKSKSTGHDDEGEDIPHHRRASKLPLSSVVVGFFHCLGQVREIRQNMFETTEFLYEPLLQLRRGDDGRPLGKVIWASRGQPTMVRFDLILTTDEAENAVATVVGQIDPRGRVRCDSTNGFSVTWSSPFTAIKTQSINPDGTESVESLCKWEFFPTRIQAGYSSKVLHLFARRIDGDWTDPESHQNDQEIYFEEDVLEDAMASLMGSSFVVQSYLPIPTCRRRVPVLQQHICNTKLHREVELAAHHAYDVDPSELTAFISESDFVRLLDGIGRRLDLLDVSLIASELNLLDRAVCDVVLRRLRRFKAVHIPTRFRNCIVNREVIEPDDLVLEVPMSLFAADEDDEVELDIVGFVEVTARTAYARATRVDFAVDVVGEERNVAGRSFLVGGSD